LTGSRSNGAAAITAATLSHAVGASADATEAALQRNFPLVDDVAAVVRDPALADLLGPDHAARVTESRVRMPAIGIRASSLRAAIADGGSIRFRTPRAVEAYIAAHGLYRERSGSRGRQG
jgi:hypothetical protein